MPVTQPVSPRRLTSDEIRTRLAALKRAAVVRLDDEEATAIAAALDGITVDSVELFGSRADPAARGGDIDLLVLTAAPALETARRISVTFFGLCEERIDVMVVDERHMSAAQAAFIETLRRVRIA